MKPTPAHQLERSEREDFRNALHNWYRNNMRQLPWRQTRNPYRIWASEIMLQQTQAKTAIAYYKWKKWWG